MPMRIDENDHISVLTTVKDILLAMRTGLVSSPPTEVAPFWQLVDGEARGTEFARPFISVCVPKVELLGSVDNLRLIRLGIVVRAYVDVLFPGIHAPIIGVIESLDAFFNGLRERGESIANGLDGFDDGSWTIDCPAAASGPRLAKVTYHKTCILRAPRQGNDIIEVA
jgi:hypothetical protein